jgi:valyl-tRNA synthetase
MADLESEGLVERIEDYVVPTAICDRCKTVIEPLLSEQWFVRMKDLAQPAIDVVKSGQVQFVPERYTRVYLDWMENIRDWTISRQLWFGHRIPVWKTADGEYIVARSEADAREKAGGREITQDEDVLDTWFSSALWPQAVLGWPEETADLSRYYPTSVLTTSREILYLWVSRMIMTGLYFLKEIPFPHVYIYATVLNEDGKRMSKSLGTGVDPLELIDQYGADALRFALLVRTAKGQDIRFATVAAGRQKQVEEARNFANKIWNASRFVLMNVEKNAARLDGQWNDSTLLADRWILSKLDETIEEVRAALEEYRINEAAQTLYHFFWDDFCDWYIELSKELVTSSEEGPDVTAARNRILCILETSLRLLHPLMPHLTEEIWQRLPHEGDSIMMAPFPIADLSRRDRRAKDDMEVLIGVITKVRNIRSEVNIPAQSRLKVHLATTDATARRIVLENESHIKRLARVNELVMGDRMPRFESAATGIVSGIDLAVPLEGLIDLRTEANRIAREIARRETEAKGLASRLDNLSFLERAPQDVVEQARDRHRELIGEIEKLSTTLESLGVR